MPELPDVLVYQERMAALLTGATCTGIRLVSPFLLRSVTPPLSAVDGRRVVRVHRLGKRLVIELEGDLFVVIHLMIAGRLRWRPGAKRTARGAVALLDFALPEGGSTTLLFTEASKEKRASLHVVQGRGGLEEHERDGVDVRFITREAFRERLRANRHTLKRSLTDPRYFDGIGNAYSDEILWHAQLSPVAMSTSLSDEACDHLHQACIDVLASFTERLRAEVGEGFPDKVTAFRDDMVVHGKFRSPCPRCSQPVQRIVYAKNETNYCVCQTGGKLLADRVLSQLMKKDWPKTLTELEERRR